MVNADDPVFPLILSRKTPAPTLEHRLLNQRVRLALEEKGGTGWLNGDRGAFIARYQASGTDRTASLPWSSGAIIAVETERSLKTRARYITIITSHLAASDAGCWHYRHVMPDDKTRVSLGRRLTASGR